jgi:succinyl-CoA synthetase beta subunit
MKIHEYQAKELFKKYNIPVPEGEVAFKPDEAAAIAKKLVNHPVVVKAQIHAGGRGKGGGVKLAQSADEVQNIAQEIIGMTLVTHQTGPEGRLVKKVLVEQGLNIEKELYLSIIPDRASAQIVVMASEAGGMDIEEVAAKTPERIIKVHINPLLGMQSYHCRAVAFGLNLSPAVIKPFVTMLKNLYRLFVDYDCSLVEINPLVITNEEMVIALDAKVNFDDNALFRHPDIYESIWTVTWAIWSMGPGWRWPPWILSNRPVQSRQIFWTWAAGPVPKWSKTAFESF